MYAGKPGTDTGELRALLGRFEGEAAALRGGLDSAIDTAVEADTLGLALRVLPLSVSREMPGM